MHVLLSMAIAVLIWSFYPFAAVKALNTMGGIELIFIATIIAAISILIISLIYFLRRNKLKQVITNHKYLAKSAWIAIIASGITNILCHGLFFMGLSLSHKAGVSLIYESWPIMAVIATPFFIRKKWKEVSFGDFLVSLIALGGVIVVILSNSQIETPFSIQRDLSEKTDYTYLLGYILAFVGGYACALNVVFKGVIAENFRQLDHQNGAIIISEFYSRVISLILLVALLPFYSDLIELSNINWSASFYVGFVVMILGGFFYTHSLINTDVPTIHILYYFVPLLAVLILWFTDESDVNLGLFLGGIVIIACNIYLYLAGRAAKFSSTR